MAATLSVNSTVTLQRITRLQITGSRGRQQTDSLGNSQTNIDFVNAIAALPGIGSDTGIQRSFRRTRNRIWQLSFTNGEWTGPISVDVNLTLVDNSNRSNRLSSAGNSLSWVSAIVTPRDQIQERRRNNGSLRWLRDGAHFDLDILSARESGTYSGTLTVEVNIL